MSITWKQCKHVTAQLITSSFSGRGCLFTHLNRFPGILFVNHKKEKSFLEKQQAYFIKTVNIHISGLGINGGDI